MSALAEYAKRDHNATSYSTETAAAAWLKDPLPIRRDHNATSYSTETASTRASH